MNGGLTGMLIGFWLHQYLVVGVAGFVVIAAFLSVISTVWVRVSKFSIKDSWYYALSLFCLVGGSVCGEIVALESHSGILWLRRGLAHIHLVVLGFVVLAVIGMVHHFLPTVWNRPRLSP